ncbi:MAG: hypothetical protein O2U61_04440, partial [Candidatus Bathyarchaeota archaeon]|nr:hypothetical protein [Candidatus Bathyarchaeota archaeon]
MKKTIYRFLNTKKFELLLWGSLVFVIALGFGTEAQAATPKFVTGGRNLLQDILKWVLILVPVAAAAMIGYHALMKSLS